MKNALKLLASLVLIACMAGCAPNETPGPKLTEDTVKAIKPGMAKSDVMTLLGEPRSRAVDNLGNETWQYRTVGDISGMAAFAAIVSDSSPRESDAYFDILTVSFKGGIVDKANYEKHVHLGSGLESNN